MEAAAYAHPNIALVKYWGKQPGPGNIPAVGSLSITLDTLRTDTHIRFDSSLRTDVLVLNGREAPERLSRVSECLDRMRKIAGVTDSALVESHNNFPTAAGLASSASGFAALVTAADAALNTRLDGASRADLARQASGSAARSIFGGFVDMSLRGREVRVQQLLPAEDWPLRVVIAITSETEKGTGSTDGMALSAATSPYFDSWVEQQPADLQQAAAAVSGRDFIALANISERSCLKMHALALSSEPGLIYWNGASISCMHTIRQMRADGLPVFFTNDAGPQIKAVCLPQAADAVGRALAQVPGVLRTSQTGLGGGAALETIQESP